MRHPQRRKRSQERLVVTVDPTAAALGALIADCANLEEQCQTGAIRDIAAELTSPRRSTNSATTSATTNHRHDCRQVTRC